MKIKIVVLLFLGIAILMMGGCWDQVEIEDRGYILGVAIDQYPPSPKEETEGEDGQSTYEEELKFEEMQLHSNLPVYAMTVQVPVLKKAATIPGGDGGKGGESAISWEITQVGNSFKEMNAEIGTRMGVVPYYAHLQVIIVSEGVAKTGLTNILDFFDRDPDMRKRTKIFISMSDAKKILDVAPRIEDYSAQYVAKVPTNSKINSRIIRQTDLGEVISSLHGDMDFVLPRIEATKDEVKVAGAAVFKDGAMAGWVDELDTEAIELIRNLYAGGIFTAPDPNNENGIIVFEADKANTKVIPCVNGNELSFIINASLAGHFAESVNLGTLGMINRELLEKSEQALAYRIQMQCQNTIQKLQTVYGADVLHFDQVLRIKEPEYWDTVKDRWHEVFPRVKTIVNVKVRIKQVGNSR